MRYGCIKCEKIEIFYATYMVKRRRVKISKTPLNSQGSTSDLSYFLSRQFRSTSEDPALYVFADL